MSDGKWICVQVGHRERYAIPVSLSELGLLDKLITDSWVAPNSWIDLIAKRLRMRGLGDRYNAALSSGFILHHNLKSLAWHLYSRIRCDSPDSKAHRHNAWWENIACGSLIKYEGDAKNLFSYCYVSLAIFQRAKELGYKLILGQIDPGPEEDAIVAALVAKHSSYKTSFRPGSFEYYTHWRMECSLADSIIVNSNWSREALTKQGVMESKIRIVPLVYNGGVERIGYRRLYPVRFTTERPLRVLFLGQCILRKGIAEAFDAASQLTGMPVEFTFVGQSDISNLSDMLPTANSTYHPRVTRAECDNFYRDADVFLFPTHSDGFGLTQLEAQSWKLPIIATEFCGEVVKPDVTGWVLGSISGLSIANLLKKIMDNPLVLTQMSDAISPWPYTHEMIGRILSE